MLPTDKKATRVGQIVKGIGNENGYPDTKDKLFYVSRELKVENNIPYIGLEDGKGGFCSMDNTQFIQQHLYILSDDEIKEGDWVYERVMNCIMQIGKDVSLKRCQKSLLVNKIIATTDQSLKLNCYQLLDFITQCSLPKPSNEFIQEFCKKDGIDEVIVEYEEILPFNEKSGYKPKVAPDNTILIYPVEDSCDRKELKFGDWVYVKKGNTQYIGVIVNQGTDNRPRLCFCGVTKSGSNKAIGGEYFDEYEFYKLEL